MFYQTNHMQAADISPPPAAMEWSSLLLHDIICSKCVPFCHCRWGGDRNAQCIFVPGDRPLTLTLKLVQARDQTRLPCEVGTNYSAVPEILDSQTNKKVTDTTKNRTLLVCGNKNSSKKLSLIPQ